MEGSASASGEREGPPPRAQQLGSPLDLASLLARVEAAKGPDRELDCRIWAHFDGRTVTVGADDIFWADNPVCGGRVPMGHFKGGAFVIRSNFRDAAPVTASIDAALALVERVRPDWRLQNLRETRIAGHEWNAHLQCWRDGVRCWGRTAPLAILAALLKALIASADGTEL